jgi:RHS repeat-associated protein
MPGRIFTDGEDYRYGFNGMEKDDEMKGDNNSLDFGARMYDPRIVRWFAVDPLAMKYPDLSPYAFVANSPILFIDPNGKEIKIKDRETGELILYKPNQGAPDGASQYVKDVFMALDYLNSEGVKDGVNRVNDLVIMEETLLIENDPLYRASPLACVTK